VAMSSRTNTTSLSCISQSMARVWWSAGVNTRLPRCGWTCGGGTSHRGRPSRLVPHVSGSIILRKASSGRLPCGSRSCRGKHGDIHGRRSCDMVGADTMCACSICAPRRVCYPPEAEPSPKAQQSSWHCAA
jgi:hypothetical protein